MFSSDQNIETIAQLVEEFKKYFSARKEYLRLTLVDRIVKLLTVVVMACILVALLMLVIIFLSFAIAHALGEFIGIYWGFAIVGIFYVCIFLMFVLFRKQWIERPLVHFLADILMGNE